MLCIAAKFCPLCSIVNKRQHEKRIQNFSVTTVAISNTLRTCQFKQRIAREVLNLAINLVLRPWNSDHKLISHKNSPGVQMDKVTP